MKIKERGRERRINVILNDRYNLTRPRRRDSPLGQRVDTLLCQWVAMGLPLSDDVIHARERRKQNVWNNDSEPLT